MMLTCIAIDDEELALELLEDNISKLSYLQLQAKFDNSSEAIAFLEKQKIDLVFLDIQMPGITGLQLIEKFPKACMFILVTAYANFALEGFNLNVVDYLVKPVAVDRFNQACEKALELFHLRNAATANAGPDTPGFFFVPVDYSQLKILFEDIIWIEGLKDYIRIHLSSTPKPVITRMSLKGIEEQLPASIFIRIQKSFIVSKNFVTSVRKNSIFIGDLELSIGENYKEAVTGFINSNFKST